MNESVNEALVVRKQKSQKAAEETKWNVEIHCPEPREGSRQNQMGQKP